MAGKNNLSDGIAKPWIDLNNFCWNLVYEKTLGTLTQMPLLGPGRDLNNKLMRSLDSWAQLYPTGINYQIVLAEIQLQSLEELLRSLISLAEKGEPPKDWSQLQQLWSRIADKVFEQKFCSEDNLKVRGKFLNAVNHHKLSQQALMEVWMKTLNMPLRSEVDEVHKHIYELRKEIKSLKKTLALQGAIAAPLQANGNQKHSTITRKSIENHTAVSEDANAV